MNNILIYAGGVLLVLAVTVLWAMWLDKRSKQHNHSHH
jgi:hypothetical protein